MTTPSWAGWHHDSCCAAGCEYTGGAPRGRDDRGRRYYQSHADTWRLPVESADRVPTVGTVTRGSAARRPVPVLLALADRKSTRLNSSHLVISYAVFCLKKKKMRCKSSST